MDYYTTGRTIRTTPEHPEGVPCILHDGDSVLCEFPSIMYGMEQAETVCKILNDHAFNSVRLSRYA